MRKDNAHAKSLKQEAARMDPGLRRCLDAESNGGGWWYGNGDKSTQWEETGEQNPRNTAHVLEGGGMLSE